MLHFFIPSKIPRKSGCVKIQALRKWELEKLKQYYAVVNLHIGKKKHNDNSACKASDAGVRIMRKVGLEIC